MTRTPFAAILLASFTLLAFLGELGCVNPSPGNTGTTVLYAYDEANHQVLAWNDVNTIYNLAPGATAAPAPDRTITGDLLSSLDTLAWGGLVVNPSTNELYLVSEGGTVVRIEKSLSQNGALSSYLDIVSFQLGLATDHLANSVFNQAAVDPSTGTLFVAETGSNNTNRIWTIANANQVTLGTVITPGTFIQNGLAQDTGGTGVAAASSGAAFAFFTGGYQVLDTGTFVYNYGPRIRMCSGGTYALTQNVLVGANTLLWDGTTEPAYGSLAYDSVANLLYVARPIASGNAVLGFYQSMFTGGNMDSAPSLVLPDTAAALANLRFIAHGRVKDWLAGADLDPASSTTASTGTGLANLYLWKGPSQGAAATAAIAFTVTSPAANAVQIRGLAMDGSQ